jgi:hypothetical protein
LPVEISCVPRKGRGKPGPVIDRAGYTLESVVVAAGDPFTHSVQKFTQATIRGGDQHGSQRRQRPANPDAAMDDLEKHAESSSIE